MVILHVYESEGIELESWYIYLVKQNIDSQTLCFDGYTKVEVPDPTITRLVTICVINSKYDNFPFFSFGKRQQEPE